MIGSRLTQELRLPYHIKSAAIRIFIMWCLLFCYALNLYCQVDLDYIVEREFQ
jgi:hypothetical protein